MDYAEIKIMAKEQKVRVTDLIVLAPANDPFYVGTDGDTLLGNWFYELWQRFNYKTGVHIRRVHYQIVSQKARVLMPNGMPYADVEKRRQFQREYKRKRRKTQEIINPLLVFKIYICPRFPFLWVGKGQFNCGFLITNDPETQSQVERHSEFARHIFPLALDLTCAPTKR